MNKKYYASITSVQKLRMINLSNEQKKICEKISCTSYEQADCNHCCYNVNIKFDQISFYPPKNLLETVVPFDQKINIRIRDE